MFPSKLRPVYESLAFVCKPCALQVDSLERQVCKWTRFAEKDISRFGGEKVAKIAALIKANAARFHEHPVGPIGDIVCLKNLQ